MHKTIGVRYISAYLDASGYAAAARSYIKALGDTRYVDLTTTAVSFEKIKTSHGSLGKYAELLEGKAISHRIQIIHLTPENFGKYARSDKYNIGYTVWETDRLPTQWVAMCNKMNEIWVPSQWNVEVFKSSGVTCPVFKVPHVVEPLDLSDAKDLIIGDEDNFVFYTIAQWIERKGTIPLLKAYLTEFKPEEKVVLALKTYRIDSSEREKQIIRNDIAHLKASLNLKDFPPITFFGDLMDSKTIKGLHKRGDCFVLSSRAEGFGLPLAEAMALGKPTIGSNYGGSLEFMNEKNSYLIPATITPVCGMIFPNYHGHMNWSDPDIDKMKRVMRHIFKNKQQAARVGQRAKDDIQKYYSSSTIGKLMYDRLLTITNSL